MIFRLKTVDGAPEDVDLGLALFRDTVSRSCLEVEGFRGGYFLVDRESGRTVTLTVWTDRQALDRGRQDLFQRIDADEEARGILGKILSHEVRFDTFELAHAIAPSAQPDAGSQVPDVS